MNPLLYKKKGIYTRNKQPEEFTVEATEEVLTPALILKYINTEFYHINCATLTYQRLIAPLNDPIALWEAKKIKVKQKKCEYL